MNSTYFDKIIDDISNENLEFSISDYFISILNKKNKRTILYQNVIKNIDTMMNIERYLKLILEMSVMKDVLFDDHQKIVFDSVTNLSNVNRLFSENNESNDNSSEYNEENLKTISNAMKLMNSRNNNIDIKMLSLI